MSEIIHDEEGGKLRLSKTRLTEVTGSITSKNWYWNFNNRPNRRQQVEINSIDLPEQTAYVLYERQRIGCRRFSPEVWAKIMKAAEKCWRQK